MLDATEDLAKKLGPSEFIIGLTIVALGTSLPEIFVGLQSVSKETENIGVTESKIEIDTSIKNDKKKNDNDNDNDNTSDNEKSSLQASPTNNNNNSNSTTITANTNINGKRKV